MQYSLPGISGQPPLTDPHESQEGLSPLVLSLISQREKRKPSYSSKKGLLDTTRFLGSSEANTGEIYQISAYRHQCKVRRAINHPQKNHQISLSAHRYYQLFGEIPTTEELLEFNRSTRAKRGSISSFTPDSRRRLKEIAGNCFPLLISQFCMTYSDETLPPDGDTAKKHLNTFLTAIRRKLNNPGYLWVLEFQDERQRRYENVDHAPPFPPLPLNPTKKRVTDLDGRNLGADHRSERQLSRDALIPQPPIEFH